MVVLLQNIEVLLAGYEAIPDGILITDPHVSVLFFNQSGKQIFNLDESAHNIPFEEFVIRYIEPEINPAPFHDVLYQIKTNNYLDTSFKFTCVAGEKRLKTKPLLGTDKEVLGRIWIISDSSGDSQSRTSSEHEDGLFKSIFDLIPQGIAISDLFTGQFFEVNKHFTEQWGYTREEVIGKNALDLDFWVDRSHRDKIVELIGKDGSFSLIPVQMQGKDKKVKEILFSGVMVTISNRPYLLSIPLDITDIVKYEENIRSLASFIELNPNPIFELNEEGVITSYNNATITIIQKYTGTPDLSHFIPGNLQEILQAVKTGTETTFHRDISLSDRFFHEYIYITKQYRTARIYVTDITERKRAEDELQKKNEELGAAYEEIISTEEELRQNYDKLIDQEHNLFEKERKLRMIVDHIPGIVLTTDADMVIKSIYGEGLNQMGRSPNEGAGKKIDEVFSHADNLLLSAQYQALSGIVSTVEGSLEDRRFVLFASPLRDVSDAITGTIGIALDITHQKNLEEERKRLILQLEQNLIELSLLNDKIRNPLTVISSLVEIHAPEIEEYITASIKDIDDIIHNLDRRWIESEKTLSFLQKHYGIGLHMP